MRYFDEIIIHCSATPFGRAVRAADIDEWHRERGFSCIGYHFVIDLDGTIEQGRPINQEGAHVKGHNKRSIGICYIGGVSSDGRPADTRTQAQKESLCRLIWRLSVVALRNGFGLPQVLGHHDLNNKKDCPCFNARAEYN